MGLGLPERKWNKPPAAFKTGAWIILIVLTMLALFAVLAATPASARWQKACEWPCFQKAAVKKTVKRSRTRRVKAKRSSGRRLAKRSRGKRPKRSKRLYAAKKRPQRKGNTKVTRATGFNVAPQLVRALVRQESGGRARVKSRAGALGKFQIMPRTARLWAARAGHPRLRRASYRRLKRALYTPRISRDIARVYVNYYKRKYGRDELVLIAYNGGPKRARQASYCLKRYGYLCVYRRETYNYVRSIFRMAGRKHIKMVCKCGYRKRRRRR